MSGRGLNLIYRAIDELNALSEEVEEGLQRMLRKLFLCMKSRSLLTIEILTLFTAPVKAGTVDGKAFF